MVAPLCQNNNWHLFQAVHVYTQTTWLKGDLFICFPSNSLIQVVTNWIMMIIINHMSSSHTLFRRQLDAVSGYTCVLLSRKSLWKNSGNFSVSFLIIRWLEVVGVSMFDRSVDHRPGSATTIALKQPYDCLFQVGSSGTQQAAVAGTKTLEQGETFNCTWLMWEDAPADGNVEGKWS